MDDMARRSGQNRLKDFTHLRLAATSSHSSHQMVSPRLGAPTTPALRCVPPAGAPFSTAISLSSMTIDFFREPACLRRGAFFEKQRSRGRLARGWKERFPKPRLMARLRVSAVLSTRRVDLLGVLEGALR